MNTQVVGLLIGDEGKANIEAWLIKAGNYDAVVRYHGGANAGESYEHFYKKGVMLHSHQVPVGVGVDGLYTAFASGGMINPHNPFDNKRGLMYEISQLEKEGIEVSENTFGISGRNQVILMHHLAEEADAEEGELHFGSTRSGISQGYAHGAYKIGMTFAEFVGPNFERILWETILPKVSKKFRGRFLFPLERYVDEYGPARERLRQLLITEADLVDFLEGKNVLYAGCQSITLDVYNSANRYSSSSVTTRPPDNVNERIGVMKLILSSVGQRRATGTTKWVTHDEGLTEALMGETEDDGIEKGTTTGRKRDLGYLDGLLARNNVRVGKVDRIAATKVDRLGKLLEFTGGIIPVAFEYRYKEGKTTSLPEDSSVLEECEPVYTPMRIGDDVRDVERLRQMREFKEFSQETQDFFNELGDKIGASIDIFSTGRWTDQKIVRV